MTRVPSSRTLALLVVLSSLAASGLSLTTRRQLAGLGGIVDEWFLVGLNLRVHGTLGIEEGRPDVVLAPGYPLFVAAVSVLAGSPDRIDAAYFGRSVELLFAAQALLLAATAAGLFLWLSGPLGRAPAFAAAMILGANPYPVVLVGLLHYDVLHIACLVCGSWLLHRSLAAGRRRTALFLACGLVFGFGALVRPVSLLMPPFVLAALLLWRGKGERRPLRETVAFVLGMMLVVGPYACRNYRLTGRLVLVNAEGWMALWGSTAADLGIHPNHYNWSLLYPTHFMPIFTRVTGSPVYSRHAFIESNLALEDAFRKEALSNLWSRPGVYARNVLGSFVAFNTRINSVFIKAFQAVQDRRTYSRQEWFAVGNSQDFHGPLGADLFSTFASGLTLLAGAGLVLALRGREEWVLAPLVVYASLCVAHSLVYMDLMYYYVRIPFLVVFAARLFAPARPESALARRVAAVISAAVPALSFALWPFVL